MFGQDLLLLLGVEGCVLWLLLGVAGAEGGCVERGGYQWRGHLGVLAVVLWWWWHWWGERCGGRREEGSERERHGSERGRCRGVEGGKGEVGDGVREGIK